MPPKTTTTKTVKTVTSTSDPKKNTKIVTTVKMTTESKVKPNPKPKKTAAEIEHENFMKRIHATFGPRTIFDQ